MNRRVHVIVTDDHYRFLRRESDRTGLPMSELVRRALDTTYAQARRPRVKGFDLSFGVWRRPDAAVIGRRPV